MTAKGAPTIQSTISAADKAALPMVARILPKSKASRSFILRQSLEIGIRDHAATTPQAASLWAAHIQTIAKDTSGIYIGPAFTARVLGQATAVSPGMLPDSMAATFAGGRYTSFELMEPLPLWRAGIADRPFGQFFSLDAPQSVIQVRIDKAVLPRWPDGGASLIDTAYLIRFPAGTILHEGGVYSRGGFYIGQTGQIVIEKAWEVPGTKVLEHNPLK